MMMKFIIFACLCVLVVVQCQGPSSGGNPSGPPHPKMQIPQGKIEEEAQHSRVARQAGPPGGGVPPGGMTGGQGNLGMQGLGNIPDPTAWIQKGQEVASQFARGRRAAPEHSPPPKAGEKRS